MTGQTHPFFRQKALQHYYRRNREENVLPHFISPPVILLFWCLLIILLISSAFAWWYRIPVYSTAPGIIGTVTEQAEEKPYIVAFFPASQLSQLHSGQNVHLQAGADGPQWQRTITIVEPKVLNPADARNDLQLDIHAQLLMTQPSVIVLIEIPRELLKQYAGSVVQVKVQVSSQRILSLLPGLSIFGGE